MFYEKWWFWIMAPLWGPFFIGFVWWLSITLMLVAASIITGLFSIYEKIFNKKS